MTAVVTSAKMAMHFIGYGAGVLFHRSACASSGSRLTTVLARNFADTMGLPRVYFDMAADNQPLGRIVMEVSPFIRF